MAQSLLSSNAVWAAKISEEDPDFFRDSLKGQTPHVRPLPYVIFLYSVSF